MHDTNPLPALPVPDDIDQTAIDEAGISAFIVVAPDSQRLLQFNPEADHGDLQSAIQLISGLTDDQPSEVVDQTRIDLTTEWLNLKSRLDALPVPPDVMLDDPYRAVRSRLQSEVDAARAALDDAGGPL